MSAEEMPPDEAESTQGWTQQAACLGMPTDFFYPSKPGTKYAPQKAVCGRCEVRAQCLEWVMDVEKDMGRDERHGVLGGLSAKERHVLQLDRDRRALQAEIDAAAATAGGELPPALDVSVGTRWRDTDARLRGRVVEVVAADALYVQVRRVPVPGAVGPIGASRVSRIALKRLITRFEPVPAGSTTRST